MDVEVTIQMGGSIQDSPIDRTIWNQWFFCWLENVERPPATGYELSVRLTDDRDIQHFNAQYRHQDRPTDVLAFAALETEIPSLPGDKNPLYLGDLIISLETAQKQAQQQGHSQTIELAWLAAHGLLHLLGWDHPDEASLQRMCAQQDHLLQQVGLTWR